MRAALQEDVPVLVEPREVAGAEPGLLQHLGARPPRREVGVEHAGAAEKKFAVLAEPRRVVGQRPAD